MEFESSQLPSGQLQRQSRSVAPTSEWFYINHMATATLSAWLPLATHVEEQAQATCAVFVR